MSPGRRSALQGIRVGDVGNRLVEKLDQFGGIDDRIWHRLTVADLAIGDVKVGELDPPEAQHLVGCGRWIVHGRFDEVVEVHALDAEGLAHMATAVGENLHDLLLVMNRIELRLDRIRSRRHEAQGEGRGEDLD